MVKVKKDLTGLTFGRWTVVKQTEDHVKPSGERVAMYECICSCDNQTKKSVRADSLTSGKSESCGCILSGDTVCGINANLVGKTFGKLTVVKRAEDYINPSGGRYAQWECECSCGAINKKIVRSGNLVFGGVTSCGCARKESIRKRCKKFNKYNFDGNVVIGKASNSDDLFYADLKDFDKIKDICWCTSFDNGLKTIKGYDANSKRIVRMHKILGFSNYDHADRSQLNNRRSNLRHATHQENSINRSRASNNTSGIVGVSFSKIAQKWHAYISLHGKRKNLGFFTDIKHATKVRLQAEKEYFGAFAPQQFLYNEYGITP